MQRDDNSEIRERFRRAHEHYESLAPSFSELLDRPRRSYRSYRMVAAALVVAMLVFTAVIYIIRFDRPQPRRLDADLSTISTWRSPTDFLLKTPGNELLKTTPVIPSPLPDLEKLQKLQTSSERKR